ncbi:hypothetical protein PR048_004691 [Dryococelus australis]|uniref:Uncharacterized protein n=1 Tax=Dryococelus australis TaxID=614101 RepID=A0ABQ9I632_9NEOP|nr:hypothetical protein PR048_004691 [Dryococelus australis]
MWVVLNSEVPRADEVTRPGIEPGSPWWEASLVIAQPPRPLYLPWLHTRPCFLLLSLRLAEFQSLVVTGEEEGYVCLVLVLFICHALEPVAPSWFETRSEIVSKIDTENCCTIRVQSWTGDRDEVHFEPPKLAGDVVGVFCDDVLPTSNAYLTSRPEDMTQSLSRGSSPRLALLRPSSPSSLMHSSLHSSGFTFSRPLKPTNTSSAVVSQSPVVVCPLHVARLLHSANWLRRKDRRQSSCGFDRSSSFYYEGSKLLLTSRGKKKNRTNVFQHACTAGSAMVDRARFPAESPPDFHMWESCRMMSLVDGFSRGPPVSLSLSFQRCSVLASFHQHRLSRLQSVHREVKRHVEFHRPVASVLPTSQATHPSVSHTYFPKGFRSSCAGRKGRRDCFDRPAPLGGCEDGGVIDPLLHVRACGRVHVPHAHAACCPSQIPTPIMPSTLPRLYYTAGHMRCSTATVIAREAHIRSAFALGTFKPSSHGDRWGYFCVPEAVSQLAQRALSRALDLATTSLSRQREMLSSSLNSSERVRKTESTERARRCISVLALSIPRTPPWLPHAFETTGRCKLPFHSRVFVLTDAPTRTDDARAAVSTARPFALRNAVAGSASLISTHAAEEDCLKTDFRKYAAHYLFF